MAIRWTAGSIHVGHQSPNVIDAVVLDLDGTICDYRRHGEEVLAEAFERVAVEPAFGIGDYYAVYEEYAGVAETVAAQREVCFGDLAERAGLPAADGREVARAYAELRDHGDVEFLAGAEEALSTLREDYRLGLVTNGAPGMQSEKLAALGLDDAFEVLVHGGHDAPPKPDPEPFRVALEALGVPAERAVHVGNSIDADVAGAKAAGLRAAWLRDGEDAVDGRGNAHEPDYVVASLADLLDPPWVHGT